MARLFTAHPGAVGAAILALVHAPPLLAQPSATTVTVTGRTEPAISIGGFGGSLATSPLQGSVISSTQLRDFGISALSGLTKLEASLSDAYDAPGYWSQLSARGFVIDNRFNYRRDGLPINAETAISLVNKDRVEVLFGTSGIQAGTSAPGGLVNLVVKRPTATLREATIELADRGTRSLTIDLSQRFGADSQFGARLNVGVAELRPQVRNLDGRTHALALALDWQPLAGSRLEFEIEQSQQRQPSMAGYSLLGNRVPDAASIDPRLNLNNQPWSLPVVLDGTTASLRWRQRLSADWTATVHGATQRLRSDDRIAFPFGCYDAGSDAYYADRYCPDGSFDLYDFRSENERRRVDALDIHADGLLRTGSIEHRMTAGVLWTRASDRFGRQAFNYVGSGRIDGSVITPAAPELTDENTNRDFHDTELYLRDAMTLSKHWQLWLGLRHSRLDRQSARTDGSRATAVQQTFTTPWLALSYLPRPGVTTYVSFGQGIESDVVPNRSRYTNRGVLLPALRSRQLEAGIKAGDAQRSISLAVFDIRRPVARDFCNADETVCTRATDGAARHRGIDASGHLSAGRWTLRAGTEWLDARREDSIGAGVNGLRPTNVPRQSARAQVDYQLTPAWTLLSLLAYEGRRAALPDNTAWIPGWSRLDLGAQWQTALQGHTVRLRITVDNVADRRAWRESPYQFSHAYLYPLAPRTARAVLSTSF